MNNIKTFNKNVKLIGVQGAKLDKLVHDTGVMGLAIAEETGDARHMLLLIGAMNAGYRVEGFKVWVQTYSPIRFGTDGTVRLIKPQAKGFTPFNVAEATAHPFWTLAEAAERVVKTLSLSTLLGLIAKFRKELSEADEHGDVYDKNGKLAKHVEGNIIDLKTAAAKLEAAGLALSVGDAVTTHSPNTPALPANIQAPAQEQTTQPDAGIIDPTAVAA